MSEKAARTKNIDSGPMHLRKGKYENGHMKFKLFFKKKKETSGI